MPTIKFTLGMDEIEVRAYQYPVRDRLDSGIVTGMTAAGQVYAYRKRQVSTLLIRDFRQVSTSQYLALKDWHENICEGPRNTFIFTDLDSQQYTVRWMNDILEWQEDMYDAWSGRIVLRAES